jgi:hypothetical protein
VRPERSRKPQRHVGGNPRRAVENPRKRRARNMQILRRRRHIHLTQRMRRILPGCGGLCILAIVCFSSRVPHPSQFSFYPQTMGAPGPSLLGTWDSKNLDSPELFFRPSSRARIVLSQVRKSGPGTPGTHLGLNSSQDALKDTRYGMLRAA